MTKRLDLLQQPPNVHLPQACSSHRNARGYRRGDYCYFPNFTPETWEEAFRSCRRHGVMIVIVPYVDNLYNPPKAHLASINSAAESEFVWSLLVEGQQYWIDGKRLGEVMNVLFSY